MGRMVAVMARRGGETYETGRTDTTLVTGASRGIGRAIALALAQEGADVAVNYVANETSAQQLVEEIQHLGRKAIAVKADVSDFPDTYRMAQEIYKEFGHLDILVNNAGITSDKTFQKMDHASWRKGAVDEPGRGVQL